MKYRGIELKDNTEAEFFIDVDVIGTFNSQGNCGDTYILEK